MKEAGTDDTASTPDRSNLSERQIPIIFLQKITDAYGRDADLANLLLDEYFMDITAKYQQAVRDVVSLAVQAGVPVPTFSSAIAYFDSYRAENLPANLIQAQRDYFGAHTYNRKDKEGTYHYSWYDEK